MEQLKQYPYLKETKEAVLTEITAIRQHQENTGRVFITDHNVLYLVTNAPEDQKQVVKLKYTERGVIAPGTVPGDLVVIAAPDLESVPRMKALVDWYGQALGLHFVVVAPGLELEFLVNAEDAIFTKYYNNSESTSPVIGIDSRIPEHLKHKHEFYEIAVAAQAKMQQRNPGFKNMLVPQQEVPATELAEHVLERMAAIEEMYGHAAVIAEEAGHTEQDEIIRRYPVGVVVRQSMGDGGYGTIFIVKEGNGYLVTGVEEEKVFVQADQLDGYINGKIQERKIVDCNYVVSRKIHVEKVSPSIGVYMHEVLGKLQIMPQRLTYQLMSDHDSCIGGGSKTPQKDKELMQQVVRQFGEGITEFSEQIISYFLNEYVDFAPERDLRGYAHWGLDFILAGEMERVLAAVVNNSSELAEYKNEVIEGAAVVECNPRYTSISISILAAAMYIRNKGWIRNLNGNVSDFMMLIRQMYGEAGENGERGGVFVWDSVSVPQNLQDTESVMRAIEAFNKQNEQHGVFIMPRSSYRKEENGGSISLIVGLLPTSDEDMHSAFGDLIEKINQHGFDGLYLINN